jgi:hypothetical protein
VFPTYPASEGTGFRTEDWGPVEVIKAYLDEWQGHKGTALMREPFSSRCIRSPVCALERFFAPCAMYAIKLWGSTHPWLNPANYPTCPLGQAGSHVQVVASAGVRVAHRSADANGGSRVPLGSGRRNGSATHPLLQPAQFG